MEQVTTIDSLENYRAWDAKCAQVGNGTRGFVKVTKTEAESWGLQMGSLKMCAERHGLKFKLHGNFGHTWSK